MKYHAFAFCEHYPAGGLKDYVGWSATLDEARVAVENAKLADLGHVATLDEDGKLVIVASWSKRDGWNDSVRARK